MLRVVFKLLFIMAFFAIPAHAQSCAELKSIPTRVNIDVIAPDPEFVGYYSKRKLEKKADEYVDLWLQKLQLEQMWLANDLAMAGLTVGGQGLAYSPKFYSENVDTYGAMHCLFFEEINVTFFYRNLVYIPSSYEEDSCEYNVIKKHSMKYHKINLEILAGYIALLQGDIQNVAAMMEKKAVLRADAPQRYEDMKQDMYDALQLYAKEYVSREMRKVIEEMDTAKAYKAVTSDLLSCRRWSN